MAFWLFLRDCLFGNCLFGSSLLGALCFCVLVNRKSSYQIKRIKDGGVLVVHHQILACLEKSSFFCYEFQFQAFHTHILVNFWLVDEFGFIMKNPFVPFLFLFSTYGFERGRESPDFFRTLSLFLYSSLVVGFTLSICI